MTFGYLSNYDYGVTFGDNRFNQIRTLQRPRTISLTVRKGF